MKKAVFFIFSTIIFLSLTTVVLAQTPREAAEARKQEQQRLLEEKKAELKVKIASRAALKQEKLDEVKRKVCERKKLSITKRSTMIALRAEKQFKVFTSIAERVDNYYQDKLLPQGIVVSDYEELLDTITDKQVAAQAAVDAAVASAKDFDCSEDDPKGQLAEFKENMKEAVSALKEYRTSIKNFIVAIRTSKSMKEATGSASQN